ncbi:MAG: ABC transporter ATP-binding protein [Polyangia bacterium]
MLVVDNLDVHYGAIQALRGVSLRVDEGQVVTLVGSNGAGKTTTLRALSGLVKPSRGSIKFLGHELVGQRPESIVRLGMAHSPEGRGVFPQLSVLENLELGGYIRTDSLDDDVEKAFVRFPRLKERSTQLAGTLSGGEQQMLAVVRALMSRPKLLLLDEPSLGLAPQIVQQIFAIIGELNREGMTILLVEQNALMALRCAHIGYVLETGEVRTSGDAKALAETDAVKKAYLGIA